MGRSRGKTKTLKSHRRTSSSLRYNLRKHQELTKKEPKKKRKQVKVDEIDEKLLIIPEKEPIVTIEDIKRAFPDLSFREALQKWSELKR